MSLSRFLKSIPPITPTRGVPALRNSRNIVKWVLASPATSIIANGRWSRPYSNTTSTESTIAGETRRNEVVEGQEGTFERDKIIAEMRYKGAELAKVGVNIDVEDYIKLEENAYEDNNFIIDHTRLREMYDYADAHWRRYRKLPTGWSSNWKDWELMVTFFYPASQYFVVIPQIDFLVNIRYGVPGEVRPVMFNNELESFIFEVVERKCQPEEVLDDTVRGAASLSDRPLPTPSEATSKPQPKKRAPTSEPEKPRQLYYLDWKEEEIYTIDNASTVREISNLMLHHQGLPAISRTLLPSDDEGEKAADRILELDATVLPLLEEKYLGYFPLPSDELSDKYLEESDQLIEEMGLGALEDDYKAELDLDPELKKESQKAYQQLVQFADSMSSSAEEFDVSRDILKAMRTMTPGEMAPLLDLFKLLKHLDPGDIPLVADELRKHYVQLEREVQQDAQVLGAVLADLKKERAAKKNQDSK